MLTGREAGKDAKPLETSRPGIYAIGDVRLNSVKRVGAAIGEGAQVVAALHGYLAASCVVRRAVSAKRVTHRKKDGGLRPSA